MSPSSWFKDFMAAAGVDLGTGKPRHKAPPGPLPTLGQYRHQHGIREFKVYCLNGNRCWHQPVLTFDELADDTITKSLDARMVCTQCGLIGSDVRPIFRAGPR